jgi:hypothetical protein
MYATSAGSLLQGEPARNLSCIFIQAIGEVVCVCLGMQECLIVPRDDVQATMKKAGIVDALKATLKHESPYSVAAAVGALHTVGQAPRGQALVEAGGAMTALVRIIEKLPSDYENDGKVSPR